MQKYRTRPRMQLPWMKDLQVGDLIGKKVSTARIVRAVSRFPDGDLRCVTLVIQRCSWTHRCYTVMNYTDLRNQKFCKFGRIKNLDSVMDHRIDKAIKDIDISVRTLDCCDVKGIR